MSFVVWFGWVVVGVYFAGYCLCVWVWWFSCWVCLVNCFDSSFGLICLLVYLFGFAWLTLFKLIDGLFCLVWFVILVCFVVWFGWGLVVFWGGDLGFSVWMFWVCLVVSICGFVFGGLLVLCLFAVLCVWESFGLCV